jgi:beta-glucosidase
MDIPEPVSPRIATLMTPEEKLDLVAGHGLWRTTPVERLGLPSIVMTDGPNGVRYSRAQVEESAGGGIDFTAFLALVTDREREAVGQRKVETSTCFPTGSSLACSWDPGLAWAVGEAMAEECAHFGVDALLAPGMNIRRTPLAGRSSEYYSEDPLVTGEIAAGIVAGLQDTGVGACVKHFAANNSEVERTTMNSVIDERALRDVYLRGFRRAIAKSDPVFVMSSYNKLNGVQTSQSEWLLSTVLRDEWGYSGLVVSDWHGIKDRPASLLAGNDLDMPESEMRKDALAAAVADGRVSAEVLDRSAARVVESVQRIAAMRDRRPSGHLDHHDVARRAAAEAIVLLKNDSETLPLCATAQQRIVVIGPGAEVPVIQGFGSARMIPNTVDVPLVEIRALLPSATVEFHPGFTAEGEPLVPEAARLAGDADIAIVFANAPLNADGENVDRADLGLAPGFDDLIASVAASARRTVVVLTVPDAVVMPWLDDVDAVLAPFFAGEGMGAALAQVLVGEVVPSGKLTTTFPRRVSDIPGFLEYPGENGEHRYAEGTFVGYRSYDARGIDPLFPFGFGLSYTRFAYSALRVTPAVETGGEVEVEFTVSNVGGRAGAEIAQVYAAFANPRVARARQLVGFSKLRLEAGESRTVVVRVTADELSYWDTRLGRSVLDDGPITIDVGASSRDTALTGEVIARSDAARVRPLTRETETMFVLDNPASMAAVSGLLQRKLDLAPDDADAMITQCVKSFVGVFDSLANRFRLTFSEGEIADAVAAAGAPERATV